MNRTALVTGAGGDIGRSVALALAADGARIVAADVDDAGVEITVGAVSDAGGEATGVHLDVTSRASVHGVVSEIGRTRSSTSISRAPSCARRPY